MERIDYLLDLFDKERRCEVLYPKGKIHTLPTHSLEYPEDVVYFYNKCNGVRFFVAGLLHQ